MPFYTSPADVPVSPKEPPAPDADEAVPDVVPFGEVPDHIKVCCSPRLYQRRSLLLTVRHRLVKNATSPTPILLSPSQRQPQPLQPLHNRMLLLALLTSQTCSKPSRTASCSNRPRLPCNPLHKSPHPILSGQSTCSASNRNHQHSN